MARTVSDCREERGRINFANNQINVDERYDGLGAQRDLIVPGSE
jgi:hypothetical protein